MVKKNNSSNSNNKLKQKNLKRDPNIIYNGEKYSNSVQMSSNITEINNHNNNKNNKNINSQNLSQIFKGNNLGDYINKIMKDEKSYKGLLEECRDQAAEIGMDPKLFTGLLNNADNIKQQ